MLFDFKKALGIAIKSNQVFTGVCDDHIKLIMANGTKQKFQKGDFIVREGQDSRNLYLIVEGSLEVSLGQEMVEGVGKRISKVMLNTLEPGACFGEYSLIDKQAVSANVRAVTNGSLFRISGPDFEKITGANDLLAKLIYKNLLEVLITRLRKKDSELDCILIQV